MQRGLAIHVAVVKICTVLEEDSGDVIVFAERNSGVKRSSENLVQ